METAERLVRYSHLSGPQRTVPIYATVGKGAEGDIEPIHPDWVAISHIPESADHPESYIVYFLEKEGAVLEFLQFETLQIALDQAQALTGLLVSEWKHCNLEIPEGGLLSRDLVV